jgi:hypothetical protein
MKIHCVWCLAFVAVGSCADPFPIDVNAQMGPSSGRAGSGGTAAGGTNAGSGGAPNNAGGSGDQASGGAAMAGAAGTGGAVADAGTGGADQPANNGDASTDRPGNAPADAASVVDAGNGLKMDARPDVRLDARPDARPDTAPVAIPLCPKDPPAPPGGEVSCPAILQELEPWFPVTPPVKGCKPPAHPETECRFYQFSWQNFLIATQPDATGRPAFLSWGTIENVFGEGAGNPSPAVPFLSGGVTQAGGRQVLIDQRGHAIHYGIHMNRNFVDFVNANGLQSADAVRNADPNLAFPADVVELKEAWQIVDPATPPANFIVTRAKVATLRVDPVSHQVVEDRTQLRDVTVALIAIHVVYTLPGHPEFIWSTFEHVDARGISDVAPSAMANPEATPNTTVISRTNHLLYQGGTTAAAANRGIITPLFDEATQVFETPPTSIYRLFTAAKSNQTDIDDDVVSINENMTARLQRARLPANDRRGNYRLVGAIWQDRPDLTFATDKVLVNNDNDPDIIVNGGDSPKSITGGEDRLSSTAMESFTQGKDSFPNCFSCHDTRAATARGVPFARDQTAPVTLTAKKLNVSHIFNEVARAAP